eukprot:SAG11_NODE_3894_length_2161_cov_2.353540_1_plen_106_part_00
MIKKYRYTGPCILNLNLVWYELEYRPIMIRLGIYCGLGCYTVYLGVLVPARIQIRTGAHFTVLFCTAVQIYQPSFIRWMAVHGCIGTVRRTGISAGVRVVWSQYS